jgi:hypothetical protein
MNLIPINVCQQCGIIPEIFIERFGFRYYIHMKCKGYLDKKHDQIMVRTVSVDLMDLEHQTLSHVESIKNALVKAVHEWNALSAIYKINLEDAVGQFFCKINSNKVLIIYGTEKPVLEW